MWTAADVQLIPKKTGVSALSNLRPISLLSIVGKLMEAVVQARISCMAEARGWFRPNQAGFRAERSALDSLAELQQRAHSAWARGNCLVAVAVDISQAFDDVWHDGVRGQLRELGVHSSLYQWVSAFLSNRWLRTRWNSEHSSWYPVSKGLPQGSPFSPTLYNLMAAPMLDGLTDGNGLVFADDTTLTAEGRTPKLAAEKLNRALRVLTGRLRERRSMRKRQWPLSSVRGRGEPPLPWK